GYLEGALIGTAFNTSFILLKTEDTNSENEVEEANWARGAEYADSMGADIISSSLGYTTFDLKSDSHTYQDMNGTTTIAARAANAAFSKGILVFCSAGNDGGDSWHYISTPADGLDVLAVGAVDANEKYAYFSSVGPSSDGRIKPDLAAQGLNTVVGLSSGLISVNSGTSFSCPLTAGLAAGIWQAFPSLTNSQMALVLKKSASQYNHPDNQLGFGIPNYLNAKQYILDSIFYNAIQLSAQFSLFPNPFKEGFLNFVISSDYYNQSITFKIYDVLGRQVAEDNFMVTSDFKNETTINAASFKSGIYIVQVYLPDKIIKTKIVVE
ncbi:MAG TPA: S8 family peptidase, partial [Cytophagaceae bacterium]|nr:S8 family peptidase [Cytophagaceae bacterium]